ncbi:MAG: choice-of-anchor tandem repeat GloVer-containing protein, partial [Candidatus Sulfotelmatobacter sp.]
ITTTGTFTTLYSFCSESNCTDGSDPQAGLVQGTDGNFYGTTYSGGTNGLGTVFKITPSGTLTTLHSFDNRDGAGPSAALIQANNGDFYGTTYSGGAHRLGSVFRIPSSGIFTSLHSFANKDGASPLAALLQATDGNFYGTTSSGGAHNQGTIFNITPTGTLTTLHNFCSVIENGVCADGNDPAAALIQATNGYFYGTTKWGGADIHCTSSHAPLACGTLFMLSVGLRPFVETQATSGEVGSGVTILGTDLTGASSVTFDGTAAVFKVVSSSEITATVPAGATTGKVEVTTPAGTLTSNVNFRVTP